MKGFKDQSVDMVLTSPPYDNLREYNGSLVWNETIWKSVLLELFRVLKSGGVVVWIVADATINGSETGTSFKQALYAKEIGFNIHDTMIYFAEKPPLTHNRYEQKFEYMFVFSKGRPKSFNPIMEQCKNFGTINQSSKRASSGDILKASGYGKPVKRLKIKGNIWKYLVGFGKSTTSELSRMHPAMFPLQLALDHIMSWSNNGDTILDPFMGSGTSGIACKNLNRNFIGIEKDETYFKIAKERINNHQPQGELCL